MPLNWVATGGMRGSIPSYKRSREAATQLFAGLRRKPSGNRKRAADHEALLILQVVGLENVLPAGGRSVELARDLCERVALDDGVRLHLGGRRRGRCGRRGGG